MRHLCVNESLQRANTNPVTAPLYVNPSCSVTSDLQIAIYKYFVRQFSKIAKKLQMHSSALFCLLVTLLAPISQAAPFNQPSSSTSAAQKRALSYASSASNRQIFKRSPKKKGALAAILGAIGAAKAGNAAASDNGGGGSAAAATTNAQAQTLLNSASIAAPVAPAVLAVSNAAITGATTTVGTQQARGAVGPQAAPGTPAPNLTPPPPAAGAMNKLVAAALVPPPLGPDASTPPPVSMIQSGQQISQILQTVAPAVAGVDGATACNEFVGYFSTVSASLNSMFTAQDPPTIQRRAAMAYIAENNEAYAASNMFNIAMQSNNQQLQQQAVQAMQLILLNTPNVLNGLQAIYENPTPQNAAAQAMGMGLVRNDKILPSIANLCQAAMSADGSGTNSFALNAQPGGQQFMYATRTFLPQGAQGFTGFDNNGQQTNGGFNAQPPNGPAANGLVQNVAAGQSLQTQNGASAVAAVNNQAVVGNQAAIAPAIINSNSQLLVDDASDVDQ